MADKTVPGIYAIVHRLSGDSYVGQAFNLQRRRCEHFSRLRRGKHKNPHLQNAFNKYGEDAFAFVVLTECSVSALTTLEASWMEIVRAGARLYNTHPAGGSPLGLKRSAATRAKISVASRGRMLGFKHSPESRARMSKAQTGLKRPQSPEQVKRRTAPLRGRAGRILTEDARLRISVALRGRKIPRHVIEKRSATIAARKRGAHG